MSGFGKYKSMEISDGNCISCNISIKRFPCINIFSHSVKRWNKNEGNCYSATDVQTIQGHASVVYYIVTPPYTASTDRQTQNFMIIKINSGSPFNYFLYEDSVASGNMTELTLYNYDRNSSNTSLMSVYRDPASVDSLGTLIRHVQTESIPKTKYFDTLVIDHDKNYILIITEELGNISPVGTKFEFFKEYTETSLTEARA